MTDFIYSEQNTLIGEREILGFGSDQFYIKEIDRDLANKIVIDNHYSKKFYAASYIHLGIFTPELVGVLQFGYAMNPSSQDKIVKDTAQDEYLELNRMWVSDQAPRNTESQAISYAIKYIRRAYPKIGWIQSFADERCGKFGIVYQAANFSYLGEHESVFWEYDGTWYHNSLMTRNPELARAAAFIQEHKDEATPHTLRQFRYIYFLKRKATQNLLMSILPYPKHYAEEGSREQPSVVQTEEVGSVPALRSIDPKFTVPEWL